MVSVELLQAVTVT